MTYELISSGFANEATLSGLSVGLRVAVGGFFASSGFHKTFIPEVRQRVWGLFDRLGVGTPFVKWAVPVGELLGGLGVLFGVLTPVAALGLLVITLGAIILDCWQTDVVARHPRDLADWFAKAIYMPETLLVLALVAVIVLGPGVVSGDAIIARVLA